MTFYIQLKKHSVVLNSLKLTLRHIYQTCSTNTSPHIV